MALRPLNTFEKAECLLDVGSKGNLNFTQVVSYEGPLTAVIVLEGIKHLQQMHPLLSSIVKKVDGIMQFVQTDKAVPLNEYYYLGPDQWKQVTKQDIAPRFDIENDPLWRVTLLKGENEGQLVITFHHAISDGVCGMQLMHHLFSLFADLLKGVPPKHIEFDSTFPPLESLYHLTPKDAAVDGPIPYREDKGYHTAFVKEVLDEATTGKVVQWTKEQGIKVNATLFAALLQAVKRVIKPDSDEFVAMNAVNFRPFFSPPVSKDLTVLLRTCLSDTFKVQGNESLSDLAVDLHQSVHSKLKAGDHVTNIKTTEKRLERDPTPEELFKRSKFPDNAVFVTNVGNLEFSGIYDSLKMKDLFFVANVEAFIESPTNVIMGVNTFQKRTYLTLWFVEELVEESVGRQILQEMKAILSGLYIA